MSEQTVTPGAGVTPEEPEAPVAPLEAVPPAPHPVPEGAPPLPEARPGVPVAPDRKSVV